MVLLSWFYILLVVLVCVYVSSCCSLGAIVFLGECVSLGTFLSFFVFLVFDFVFFSICVGDDSRHPMRTL